MKPAITPSTIAQAGAALRYASRREQVARGLLAAWLTPVLASLCCSLVFSLSTPVHAQAVRQTAVVLDFSVAPGIDPMMGRKIADALSVELARSGGYDVVTRQQIEQAIATTQALTPPFTELTQMRLATAVGASSVFSGRIVRVDVENHRSARVQAEVRQLEVSSGDYINGTQVAEITENRLVDVDNDVLIDEALNKAASSGVRGLRQTRLPVGVVLNTLGNESFLSIGQRDGVAKGQRYSVTRVVRDRSLGTGTDLGTLIRVGEIRITDVESDQATGTLAAGGSSGIRTGDHVREIWTASPVFPVSASGSSTSVTAPPPDTTNTPRQVRNRTVNGILALLAMVGMFSLINVGRTTAGAIVAPAAGG